MDMSHSTTPATLGIAALAEHHAHLLTVVSDKDRDGDELTAVGTMILSREPTSRDDLLSLAIALHNELEAFASNHRHSDDADLLNRLTKASHAIARGLIKHTGAESPMTCDLVDRVE
jgi:hypothetical protein